MKLYTKDELKHSRIFFDKKPPIFLTIFIISITIILILTIVGAYYVPKNYIVKASGTITTTDNTYVTSLGEGTIININKPSGSHVEVGETLFEVSSGTEGVQLNALNQQLQQTNDKINTINLFQQSLDSNKNLLSNSGIQQEYYAKVEYYLQTLNDEQATKENTDNKVAELSQEKTNLETDIKKLKETISQLESTSDTSQNEVTNDNIIDDSLNKEVSKLDESKAELEAKESELETVTSELEQYTMSSTSQATQTKLQLSWEASAAKSTLETNVIELQGQIDAYSSQDTLLVVTSETSGYIHYLSPIKEGMALQKGQTIGEISKNENTSMEVEAYIPASDISKVNVNDPVKVAISGVNTQQYGTLPGTVTSIDKGTITQETNEGNQIYYRCVITLDASQLVDSKNNTIDILKSMPVEARIVYDNESYLDWILDMLNFTN